MELTERHSESSRAAQDAAILALLSAPSTFLSFHSQHFLRPRRNYHQEMEALKANVLDQLSTTYYYSLFGAEGKGMEAERAEGQGRGSEVSYIYPRAAKREW